MKFGVIHLGSIGFYNLCVRYVNSLFFNFRALYLEFELLYSMCVFNAVNESYYE